MSSSNNNSRSSSIISFFTNLFRRRRTSTEETKEEIKEPSERPVQTTIQEVSNQITETANRLEAVSSRIRTLSHIERTILLASMASSEPSQTGSIAVPRVRRRRRRLRNLDISSDQEDNNEIEDYEDFRTYPLTINWKAIEEDETAAYDVYENYGLFGVSLFDIMTRKLGLNVGEDDLPDKLITYYLSLVETSNKEKSTTIEKLILNFPSPSNVNNLLKNWQSNRKESVLMRFYFDILYHHFSNSPSSSSVVLLEEILPGMENFYLKQSEDDTKFLNNEIQKKSGLKLKMKSVMNSIFARDKEGYLSKIKLRRKELQRLFTEAGPGLFVI